MNIIRRLKERRKMANLTEEDRENLYICRMPTNCGLWESRIAGISALPAEIWGIIIDYMVVEEMGSPYMQCCSLPKLLQYRLVCRLFDKEVQHSLHQRILQPQIPHLPFMRAIMQWQPGEKIGTTLYKNLLASAICNSASTTYGALHRNRVPSQRIVERIRNCVIMATHLPNPIICRESETHNGFILQRLCTAVSTSTYCQEYIYMPGSYAQYFGTYAEGDAYLEMALLVACGYKSSDVVAVMVEFVKTGKLKPYVGGKVWGHTKSGRRWLREFDDGERKWDCGRCGKTFEDDSLPRLWIDTLEHVE